MSEDTPTYQAPPPNLTLRNCQRVLQAMDALSSADADADPMALFAEHADHLAAVVEVLLGEQALDQPMHQVLDHLARHLPDHLRAITTYMDTSLRPAIERLTPVVQALAETNH